MPSQQPMKSDTCTDTVFICGCDDPAYKNCRRSQNQYEAESEIFRYCLYLGEQLDEYCKKHNGTREEYFWNEEIIRTSKTDNPVLLPRIHCHMLRHTYGTRLNDAGVNVKAMQAMLGHRDIDTTMQIYVDASENLISNAMDGYEEMINKMFPDYIPH